MKIALLGYGIQNVAALEYWNKPENQITICDQNELQVPEGYATRFGDDYLKDLDQFDLLVRIPSLHPNDIIKANPDSPHILEKVTTVTNEFFKVCPSKNIIGITGTKGKGTTSTLVTKILEAAGKKVHLGGNIGIAPLAMLKDNIQPTDWVVLELANFQLIDIKFSPKIAVCLMVVPEHLNWHTDMEEYVVAKQQMFLHQTIHDLAIFNRANAHSQEVASVSAASKLSYAVPVAEGEPQQTTGAYVNGDTIYMNKTAICKISEVGLLGRHNLENICAAIATTWGLVDHNTELIKQVVSQFKGLEHRLELVREFNSVKYYDDSFGTTPETAVVAIQAFEQPKVVILGGSEKEATFDGLAQVVATHNVRSIVLIGDTAPKIREALQMAGFENIVSGGNDMATIVENAHIQAHPGDVVLLSTACASFDMFKNYQDRGEQFKRSVQSL
ncbi:MAG: UDP-N-acetylmuramoyl-L-alanine--D-glutamate ligase [Candidatus Saccharimonadales bacterium]